MTIRRKVWDAISLTYCRALRLQLVKKVIDQISRMNLENLVEFSRKEKFERIDFLIN